ncbi:MAG: hypothetical protein WAV51_00230 [Microgenomates group bacterium]
MAEKYSISSMGNSIVCVARVIRTNPRRVIIAALCCFVIASFFVFRGKYMMTVWGFLHTDFVVAENGASYRTNEEPHFTAHIGSASDKSVTKTAMTVEGKQFSLTYVPNLATESANFATHSAVTATDSAESTYSLFAQLDAMNKQIISTVGKTEQVFDGPREVISHEGLFQGSVIYSIDAHKFIEEWTIQQLLQQQITFRTESPDYICAILPDQTWEYRNGAKPMIKITTTVTVDGVVTTLPTVSEKKIEAGNSAEVQLIVPIAAYGKHTVFTRVYERVDGKTLSPTELLQAAVGEKLATQSALLSFPVHSMTMFGGEVVLINGDDHTAGVLSPNGLYTALPLTLDTVACGEQTCYGSDASEYVVFSPHMTVLQGQETEPVSRIPVGDGPIGGIAVVDNTVYRTAATSPVGGIYTITNFEKDEQKIYSGYSNANEIAVHSKLKNIAFIADGQLQTGELEGDVHPVQLPSPILSISFGTDGYLYGIMSYEKRQQDMIVRISLATNSLEILNNVSGQFSSLVASEHALIISMNIADGSWAIVPIPFSDMRWHTYAEGVTQ